MKSKSRIIAEKTIFETFAILKENDGSLRGRDVIDQIRGRVEFNEYEKHQYGKTGYIRWESILHFYTIDCVKAGFLRKEDGIWYLTNEGQAAISLGPEKLFDTITAKYKEWDTKKNKKSKKDKEEIEEEPIEDGDLSQQQVALLSQYEDSAREGIRNHIDSLNPYEFQDLVALLLKAMDYKIAHKSPKGKDGGIDIIAYTDPLGVNSPRIIVQVKHRPEATISSDDIQRLAGTMKRPSDVGLFVTSGGFSNPAVTEARSADKHIELIDFSRLIRLWQEYYHNLTDEEKNILPLHPIYFLGANQ